MDTRLEKYPKSRFRHTYNRAALFRCTDYNEQYYQPHQFRNAFVENKPPCTGRNKKQIIALPCRRLLLHVPILYSTLPQIHLLLAEKYGPQFHFLNLNTLVQN